MQRPFVYRSRLKQAPGDRVPLVSRVVDTAVKIDPREIRDYADVEEKEKKKEEEKEKREEKPQNRRNVGRSIEAAEALH